MKKTRIVLALVALVGLALFLSGCPGKNMMSQAPQAPTHQVG